MATFIEEPRIDAGMYTLEIIVPRAAFLPTKEYSTCLNFDLVVEYVSRTHGQNAAHDGLYEILAIRPLSNKKLWKTDDKVIDIDFDREYELDDLVSSLSDRRYVCSLVNTHDASNVIHPVTAQKEAERTLRLQFNFATGVKIPQGHRCYSLRCSTLKSKGAEHIRHANGIRAEYCFETETEHAQEAATHCNPHALPKLHEDGRCICADPYAGLDCESCQEGFKAVEAEKSAASGQKQHVECVIDHDHMSSAACNSHGRPRSDGSFTHIDEVKCDCDKGYGGAYCDYCTDASFAYPDCTDEMSATIYN